MVTDVGVVDIEREPMPAGAFVVSKTVSGAAACLRSDKSSTFLYVKKEPRAGVREALADIAFVFPGKREPVPPQFRKLDKCVSVAARACLTPAGSSATAATCL